MAEGWQGVLDTLLGVARDYVGAGIRISVKTNYTPELAVATTQLGTGEGGGERAPESALSRMLGVKAAVIVRNEAGQVIATYGEVPKVDPVRALLALGLAGGLVYLLVRGALR